MKGVRVPCIPFPLGINFGQICHGTRYHILPDGLPDTCKSLQHKFHHTPESKLQLIKIL